MTTGTNILAHTIDDASTVSVITEGTAFASLGDISDLQSCFELIDEHAVSPIPNTPNASDTVYGITKYSTESEVLDNTDNISSVTPFALNHWMENHATASELSYGFVRLLSTSDVDEHAPEENVPETSEYAITLKTLNHALDVRFQASETNKGVARLATQAQAETSGSLANNVAMTPLRVKQMLDVWANTTSSDANETTKGLIRFCNASEVNTTDSTVDRLAISPYRFNNRTATLTRKAGFYLPTAAIASARTSNEHALTAGTLDLFSATTTKEGVAAIVNNLYTNSTTKALSARQGYQLSIDKIGPAGGNITGTLRVNDVENISGDELIKDGKVSSTSMLNMYPVGAIYVSTVSTNPSAIFGGSWTSVSQGRVLMGSSTSYPAGSTGGEYTHTLTEAEMPSHKHAGWGERSGRNGQGIGFGVAYQYGRNNPGSDDSDTDNYLYYSSPEGGGQAHNNMQPYLVVYMWERTG